MSLFVMPVCPVSCSASLVPALFDECAPVLHYGEVSKIYVTETGVAGAEFANNADVEDLAKWVLRLDPTGVLANAIVTLIVIGEVALPDRTEINISGGRTIYSPGTYTLNFEIDETNDTNYNFLLNTQCNLKYKFWYETSDGMLYGGIDEIKEGIDAVFKLNQPIPKGREEIVKMIGEIKWKSAHDPLRCVSPMA